MRNRGASLWLIGAVVLGTGCAHAPRAPVSEALPLPDAEALATHVLPERDRSVETRSVPDPGSDIVLRALSFLGIRYRYGGTTPESGFDCSGFVRWVFREHPDVDLPRASDAMSRSDAPSIEPADLRPGDLVFFRIRGRRVSHVGIYIGEHRFVHAPSRGGSVRVDRLDDAYWHRRFAGAKRVLQRA